MKKITAKILTALATLAIIFGFIFVTQASQEGAKSKIQNDGYASIGGILILSGGSVLGYMYGKKQQ